MRAIAFLLLLVASQAWAQFASPRNLAGSATSTCSTANAVLYNASTPCSANLTAFANAGDGILLAAGTAASNARRALSISQTWTDGTSSNIGIVGNFDMGATGTAAGKLLSLQAGAAGTTEVYSISSVGDVISPSLAVQNAAGTVGHIFQAETSTPYGSVVAGLVFGSGGVLAWDAGTFGGAGNEDTSLSRVSAGVIGVGTGTAGSIAGGIQLASVGLRTGIIALSATAPTIASGFGTSPTVPSNNGTAAFTINVGTGGTASSGVVTMPAATTGWDCKVDYTGAPQAAARTTSAPTSTTSITLTNYTIATAAALAWTASQVLNVSCLGY